jgi:hypothetical protein
MTTRPRITALLPLWIIVALSIAACGEAAAPPTPFRWDPPRVPTLRTSILTPVVTYADPPWIGEMLTGMNADLTQAQTSGVPPGTVSQMQAAYNQILTNARTRAAADAYNQEAVRQMMWQQFFDTQDRYYETMRTVLAPTDCSDPSNYYNWVCVDRRRQSEGYDCYGARDRYTAYCRRKLDETLYERRAEEERLEEDRLERQAEEDRIEEQRRQQQEAYEAEERRRLEQQSADEAAEERRRQQEEMYGDDPYD